MAKTKGEAPTKYKEKAPAKAEESWAKVEEEAARARTKEARAKAEQKARAKAEEKARIKVEQEARVKAEEEARAKADQEWRAKAEQEARILESATPAAPPTGFESIAAETIDYSKKSLANGSALVEKLLGAKSFESAIYIRSEYARTSYADFAAKKIGELNTKLAIEAFKRHSHVA